MLPNLPDARDPSGPDLLDLARRLFLYWNTRDPALAVALYAPGYRGLDLTDRSIVQGPEGVSRQLARYAQAFPDLLFESRHTICQHDSAALYWTARGTHHGPLLNIPATGRVAQVHGVTLVTVAAGRITQGVHLWDMAALLRDIGLLPELSSRAQLDPDILSATFPRFA